MFMEDAAQAGGPVAEIKNMLNGFGKNVLIPDMTELINGGKVNEEVSSELKTFYTALTSGPARFNNGYVEIGDQNRDGIGDFKCGPLQDKKGYFCYGVQGPYKDRVLQFEIEGNFDWVFRKSSLNQAARLGYAGEVIQDFVNNDTPVPDGNIWEKSVGRVRGTVFGVMPSGPTAGIAKMSKDWLDPSLFPTIHDADQSQSPFDLFPYGEGSGFDQRFFDSTNDFGDKKNLSILNGNIRGGGDASLPNEDNVSSIFAWFLSATSEDKSNDPDWQDKPFRAGNFEPTNSVIMNLPETGGKAHVLVLSPDESVENTYRKIKAYIGKAHSNNMMLTQKDVQTILIQAIAARDDGLNSGSRRILDLYKTGKISSDDMNKRMGDRDKLAYLLADDADIVKYAFGGQKTIDVMAGLLNEADKLDPPHVIRQWNERKGDVDIITQDWDRRNIIAARPRMIVAPQPGNPKSRNVVMWLAEKDAFEAQAKNIGLDTGNWMRTTRLSQGFEMLARELYYKDRPELATFFTTILMDNTEIGTKFGIKVDTRYNRASAANGQLMHLLSENGSGVSTDRNQADNMYRDLFYVSAVSAMAQDTPSRDGALSLVGNNMLCNLPGNGQAPMEHAFYGVECYRFALDEKPYMDTQSNKQIRLPSALRYRINADEYNGGVRVKDVFAGQAGKPREKLVMMLRQQARTGVIRAVDLKEYFYYVYDLKPGEAIPTTTQQRAHLERLYG